MNTVSDRIDGCKPAHILKKLLTSLKMSAAAFEAVVQNMVDREYKTMLFNDEDRSRIVTGIKVDVHTECLSWENLNVLTRELGFAIEVGFRPLAKENEFKETSSVKTPPKTMLDVTVFNTNIAPRYTAILFNNNAEYVGQLVQMTDEQLLGMKGIGDKALGHIKEVLKEYGLHLAMDLRGEWKVPSEEVKADQGIDQTIYDKTLEEFGLREHVTKLFRDAGYTHVGHLAKSSRNQMQSEQIGNVFIDVVANLFKKHKLKFYTDLGNWKPPVVKTK